MRIAIIGTGKVGRAIALGLRGKGHVVVLGTRDPETADSRALAAETGAVCATPAAAAAGAEVVMLALPWAAAEDAVKALGDLSGKVVVDCMNPLGMVNGRLDLVLGHSASGGEAVQGWLPGAQVVKALNQVGAEITARNDQMSARPVQFLAGNDAEAKAVVGRLLADLGFEALDAGDLTRARLLEPLAMVWINQAMQRGMGRGWALSVIR